MKQRSVRREVQTASAIPGAGPVRGRELAVLRVTLRAAQALREGGERDAPSQDLRQHVRVGDAAVPTFPAGHVQAIVTELIAQLFDGRWRATHGQKLAGTGEPRPSSCRAARELDGVQGGVRNRDTSENGRPEETLETNTCLANSTPGTGVELLRLCDGLPRSSGWFQRVRAPDGSAVVSEEGGLRCSLKMRER
jgi:hypothetical protein